MAGFNLTIKNDDRIRAKLGPELYTEFMSEAVADTATFMARSARSSANQKAHDTGGYASSIVSEVHGMEARVYSTAGIVADVIEYGRRPGARMPPPDALSGWASRHGIPQTALFVLARSIGRKGIKAKHIFRDARARTIAQVPTIMHKAYAKIAARWYGVT